MKTLEFSRKFQIWKYSVSHSQLLLRSNKGVDVSTRIEILFKDVSIINIPTSFKQLRISEVEKEQIVDLDDKGILPEYIQDSQKIFRLSDGKFEGYVVSGIVLTHEDDKEYYEDSHFGDM